MTAFTVERGFPDPIVHAGRFDAVLDQSREAYLASPLGKTRKAIAKASSLTLSLTDAMDDLSCALTRGDGTEHARRALQSALIDLTIAVGDAEALARIVEAA